MTNTRPEFSSYKIVSLIASIIAILACFIGAVTWVSINMANNAVSIDVLREGHVRHETLIAKNSEIINQHAHLLAILDKHESALGILTNFMTQGGRFTERDGKDLHNELQIVKDKLQYYEVLKTELKWIKESMNRLEVDIARRFDGLTKKLDVSPNKKM